MPSRSLSAVVPFDERKCVQQQATCQVTIAGDGPAEVGSKSAGGAFGEEVTEAPPIMLLIRPQLPSLEAWRRNPAKAVYHLITLPIKLVLFPFYKVRIHTLTPYMTCPESDTAQAVAKEISGGIIKEQETVGLVGALLLSIAAQVLFSVPETIASITGHLSALRNIYLLCGALAFGCEALAVCFSVLLILMLNAQQTDDAYTDLILFLKGFWTVCGLTPILAAVGLWAVSGAMVLYCCAGYITGSITLAVPVVVGVACVAAYVLTFAILLKVLLRSLKPLDRGLTAAT